MSPAMTDAPEAGLGMGSIHVEAGGLLPQFLVLRSQSLLNSWPLVTNVRSTFDAEIRKAGWVFFFMAGKIEKTAFGFDKRKTLRTALNRLPEASGLRNATVSRLWTSRANIFWACPG